MKANIWSTDTYLTAFFLIGFQLKVRKYLGWNKKNIWNSEIIRNAEYYSVSLRLSDGPEHRKVWGICSLHWLNVPNTFSVELERMKLIRFNCASGQLYICIFVWTNKHRCGGQISSKIYLFCSHIVRYLLWAVLFDLVEILHYEYVPTVLQEHSHFLWCYHLPKEKKWFHTNNKWWVDNCKQLWKFSLNS